MIIPLRLALAIAFSCCATIASTQDFAKIYSRYAERVAHVEVVGELYDGSIERNSGSGVLLGFGLVLTNSHVLPNEKNFKKMDVFVRFRGKDRDPYLTASFERDVDRDLALLSLMDPAAQDNGPIALDIKRDFGKFVAILAEPRNKRPSRQVSLPASPAPARACGPRLLREGLSVCRAASAESFPVRASHNR